ncbi:hypothetical protein ACJROX_23145 [Pseudalkalibacillus sp. A8]|uniref:hypothetical protein n=1 Tax=Pseudalkalibacillus sp. A8 TaxID=3382641 RepID=UPI0038B504A6
MKPEIVENIGILLQKACLLLLNETINADRTVKRCQDSKKSVRIREFTGLFYTIAPNHRWIYCTRKIICASINYTKIQPIKLTQNPQRQFVKIKPLYVCPQMTCDRIELSSSKNTEIDE